MTDSANVRLTAAVRETHISTVFFLGDRVYKLKKPVKLDFLDFSTIEAREQACHREVALNRRLAPDVYLGVAEVHDVDGRTLDHLVVMRRMPDERRLSTLVRSTARRRVPARGGADRRHVPCAGRDVGRIAAAGSVENSPGEMGVELRHDGTVRRLSARSGHRGRAVEELARRYLDGRGPLFDAPRRASRRCGTVTATCSPTTSSASTTGHASSTASSSTTSCATATCSPTSRSSRWTSNASVRRTPAPVPRVVQRVRGRDLSGVACAPLHRVPGPRAGEGGVPARRARRRDRGRRRPLLLQLTLRAPPAGSGRAHAGRRAARHRQVDARGRPGRSARMGRAAVGRAPQGPRRRRPHDARARRVPRGPLRRTRDRRDVSIPARPCGGYSSSCGEPVILDASWTDPRWRDEAKAIANDTASDLHELRCVAPIDVVRERLVARASVGTDASDATSEIAARMAADCAPWPTATVIDTSCSPEGRR